MAAALRRGWFRGSYISFVRVTWPGALAHPERPRQGHGAARGTPDGPPATPHRARLGGPPTGRRRDGRRGRGDTLRRGDLGNERLRRDARPRGRLGGPRISGSLGRRRGRNRFFRA